MSRGAIVVFAKQPLEGAVKTRMTPPLAPAEAAELYGHMLDDVLEVTANAARELDLEALLAVHPRRALAEMAGRAPAPFRAVAQRGPGLAARMAWVVGEAGAAGRWPVLLRGSDSPALAPGAIAEALTALQHVDLAMIPDRDGGYSLIGLRRPAPDLFAHAMSTSSVAEDTLRAAERLGLSTRVLGPCFDLDTVEDLHWLAEARSPVGVSLCPRTLEYLDERDLWRHLGPAARPRGRE